MRTRLHASLFVAVLALATGVRALTAEAEGLVTVHFGSVGGITDAGLYLADEYGYFRAAGVTVVMQRLPNAPTLLTATATGQLDVAGISVTPGLFAAAQQDIGLRIVGDKQSHRPGFAATRLVARPSLVAADTAATLRGLRGKTIAVSAKASSPYMDLVRVLAAHGIDSAGFHAVELAYPNMIAALASDAVDAAVVLEPFLSQSIAQGVAKEVSDLADPEIAARGESRITVPLVYSAAFIQNRPAAQAFMTAYMKGVRVYNDAFVKGRDKDKVSAIIAQHAGVDPKIVRDGFPAGLDPNQRVSAASLEACQQFFLEQHYLQTAIPIDKVVDPSFAEAAVAALGEYH